MSYKTIFAERFELEGVDNFGTMICQSPTHFEALKRFVNRYQPIVRMLNIGCRKILKNIPMTNGQQSTSIDMPNELLASSRNSNLTESYSILYPDSKTFQEDPKILPRQLFLH